MAKKLLNAPFSSIDGMYQWSLSANAPDGMAVPATATEFLSSTKPLGQVGALFFAWDSNRPDLNATHQIAVYKELANNGYGPPIGLLPENAAYNVPMYLFGAATRNGVAMPYVKFVNGSYTYVLHYFKADGTDLGYIFRYIPSDNAPSFYAGQLYDDGTFTGNAGYVRAFPIGVNEYSQRYYYWSVTRKFTNQPIINDAIINDLREYLPFAPEGEWSSDGIGDFDATSDDVDFPGLPSLDVISTGLCTIYKMSSSNLVDLANFLWSNLFDLDTFKKLFADPMEAILNLSIMPVDATAATTASNVKIGNITTDAEGHKVTSQYKIIDFGKINLNEYWGSFADYSPYTKLSIFLPYVGMQQLSIDDVMNGTINLKAYVDVLTGSVQYVLKSKQGNHRQHGHNSVLYTWGGNCQYQIPLSASNMTQVINSIVSTAGTVAGGIGVAAATGGMTAPIAAGMAASTISNVMNSKTHIQRGGGIGGSIGIFGIQKPYLIMERPEEVYPENYNHTIGEPASRTGYLTEYSGFVKVEACNLTISGASEDDLNEIENLLKGGVLV